MTVGLRYSTFDFIGFISTIILFVSICVSISYGLYSILTTIKFLLVCAGGLILFTTKLYLIDKYYFNKYAMYLVMLNIVGLIFIGNPMIINILVILVTITTPNFQFINNEIEMKDRFIDKSLWIIFMTFVLLYIYIYNKKYFNCLKCTPHKIVNSLVIFALFIPTVLYFIDGKWLEYRALLLNFIITLLIILKYIN
tara:strand:- start:221 stop:808 length:588 start_codon:yes stop_codon:yes gene_type:complete